MTQVTNKQRTQWGANFKERSNSYDDAEDLGLLAQLCLTDVPFRELLSKQLPETEMLWRMHPDGQYGVDAGLITHEGERCANFDVERWSAWDSEWPSYYRYIHFLARKDKFLNQGVPFFMCFLNKSRDKCLVVDEETILKYPIKNKFFKAKNTHDMVREMPMSEGYVFGNITDKERGLFKT